MIMATAFQLQNISYNNNNEVIKVTTSDPKFQILELRRGDVIEATLIFRYTVLDNDLLAASAQWQKQ